MSTLRVDAITDQAGTAQPDIDGVAKAWVNFDGTAATISVRASFNVSSVTDNGTANYTINFENALEDSDYACASMAGHATGDGAFRQVEYDQDHTKSTTALQIKTVYSTATYYDSAEVYVVIFR